MRLNPKIGQPTPFEISAVLEKGVTFVFWIISVNIDFTKKCYDSQFVRNEDSQKLCIMIFFHICIIVHVINKFHRK